MHVATSCYCVQTWRQSDRNTFASTVGSLQINHGKRVDFRDGGIVLQTSPIMPETIRICEQLKRKPAGLNCSETETRSSESESAFL